MTIIAASKNEPSWVTIARANGAKYESGTPLADADIPPPREAESALFVADCLNSARSSDPTIPPAPETIGELSMYGVPVDVTRTTPQVGMIVIVNQPQFWIPANKTSAAARMPNTAKSHVGFLVRSTLGQVYVLGEGAIRAFPKRAVGALRSVR